MVRPWYGDDAVQGGAMTRFAMAFLVGAMPSVASARPNNAALGVCSDVACRIAVINAASLRPSRNGRIGFKPPYSKGGKDPYGQAGHRGIGRGIDRRSGVCGNTVGGGIFALRRPRPYSRHCVSFRVPNPIHCRHYAHTMPPVDHHGICNDAARRVATSFEKRENRI